MKVAMMQPAFLPWQGYFELAANADVFIFLDDFQYSIQSYHQRNRLFVSPNTPSWYTVPVCRESHGVAINNVKIAEEQPWRKKMWKRLRSVYSKAPFFDLHADELEQWLLTPWSNLAEQNTVFIKFICRLLDITPTFLHSSALPEKGRRTQAVCDLLRWSEATEYYAARGSFGYMFEDGLFPISNVRVMFQDFKPRPYYQQSATTDFFPSLSVLDALLNVDLGCLSNLISSGTERWISWDELVENAGSENEDAHSN